MTKYILDTNILADVGRGAITCTELGTLTKRGGAAFLLAPPVLIELFDGIVQGGDRHFEKNQRIFICARQLGTEILELPGPFVWRYLWNITSGKSGVRPTHYSELIDMFIGAASFGEFLRATEERDSVWKKLEHADKVHRAVLNYELQSLRTISYRRIESQLANVVAKQYSFGGLFPNPEFCRQSFSAAFEYLEFSLEKVRNGAKPERNDRGLYNDFQLFWYLADPEIVIVTNEDFSAEIRRSPQKDRVLTLAKTLDG